MNRLDRRQSVAPGTSGSADPTVSHRARTAADNYLGELRKSVDQVDRERLSAVLCTLVGALESGRRVLVAGNGGSATTASHMSADLTAAMAHSGRPAGTVVSLVDNLARLTAIANDVSYEDVFATQVAALGAPGDVLLAISVSGRSANVLAAARRARDLDMTVLALVGQPSPLSTASDHFVLLGQGDYGLSEDLHLTVGHIAVRMLRRVDAHVVADA
ncbi:D-sedoheptulose 7-phosphate isomerase [Plantactinospora mayteni]|uniref:Phosphoheptose isomerase n=1 Tax=Plantactinospora mayteni TaxID=566021 RepID=A0ABQ4EFM0_9ACTN|nr:SIS domain-containing protein [Plantactinospora mayteni]GIG93517.1 phosphoheptose isomerase [Plantactinospora mayteni]